MVCWVSVMVCRVSVMVCRVSVMVCWVSVMVCWVSVMVCWVSVMNLTSERSFLQVFWTWELFSTLPKQRLLLSHGSV